MLALVMAFIGCKGHAAYEADSGQVAPSSRSPSGNVDAAADGGSGPQESFRSDYRGIAAAGELHVRSPRLREGEISVNGHLPPENIKKIVRLHFRHFRLCYEDGLRDNPNLRGKVIVKFIIDQSGAVSTTADDDSDIPDQNVVQCVEREFGNLSFPQPKGGMVTVVYSISMSPSVD